LVLQDNSKYAIVPFDWKMSTQDVFHEEIAKYLGLQTLKTREINNLVKLTFIEKFIAWRRYKKAVALAPMVVEDRMKIVFNGIVLSHSVIEQYIRFSENGKVMFGNGFYKLLRYAVKYQIKAEKLFSSGKVGYVLSGDVAYIDVSVA